MAEPQTPQETSVPSQKRPLEEPSSPSGPTDGPDAKRPALDKVIRDEGVTEVDAPVDAKAEDEANNEDAKEEKPVTKTSEDTADL